MQLLPSAACGLDSRIPAPAGIEVLGVRLIRSISSRPPFPGHCYQAGARQSSWTKYSLFRRHSSALRSSGGATDLLGAAALDHVDPNHWHVLRAPFDHYRLSLNGRGRAAIDSPLHLGIGAESRAAVFTSAALA